MSKKLKTIICGAVVLVLLIGVLLFLLFLPKPTTEDASSDTSSQTLYHLVEEEKKNVVSVHIQNAVDDYTIDRVGEEKWLVKELEDITTTDTTIFDDMVASAASMGTYDIAAQTRDNLSSFGLEKPQATVTVTYDGGKTAVLLIGNATTTATSTYACVNDDPIIYAVPTTSVAKYLVPATDYLDKTLTESFTAEDGSPAMPELHSYKLERPDLPLPIELHELDAADMENSAVTQVAVKMTSPIKSSMNSSKTEKSIYSLFGITAESIVCANPTEAQMKEYGLDNPAAVVSAAYENTAVTLTTGKKVPDQEGLYYVLKSTNNVVYTVKAESMAWMTVKADELISPIAVLPMIADIKTIDLVLGQKSHTIELTNVSSTDEDGSSSNETTKVVVDGKSVEVDQFKRFLQLLLYTPVEGINYSGTAGTALAFSFKYTYNNGGSDLVEVYSSTNRMGVLAVNGEAKYLARLAYADKVSTELDHLLAGEKVDTEW